MSIARSQTGVSVLAMVIVACSTIPWTTTPLPFPVNSCRTDDDCAAYAQDPSNRPVCGAARACVSVAGEEFTYTLVVSMPDTAGALSDVTFTQEQTCLGAVCGVACDGGNCATLPVVAQLTSWYAVPGIPDIATAFGVTLGNGSSATALPASVIFRPLLGALHVPAQAAGLPLLPVQAQPFVSTEYTPVAGVGPFDGGTVAFAATLAPMEYEVTITPDPPFREVFPPFVQRIRVNGGSNQLVPVAVNADPTPSAAGLGPVFSVARFGGLPLDGFAACLRDPTTHRPVSAFVPLHGESSSEILLATNEGLDGGAYLPVEFALYPPIGSSMPTLVVGDQTGGAPPPSDEVYPPLPPPVTVFGILPTAAQLSFASTSIATLDGGAGNALNLEYSTQVETSAESPDGGFPFEAVVPVGTYSVAITPASPDVAVTTAQLSVDEVQGGTFTNLALPPTGVVTGRVLVADGRLLASARVELRPSSADAGTPPPRPSSVTSAEDGTFSLTADPGTYDLTVEPAGGSRLPWVVRPGLLIPRSTDRSRPTVSLGDMVVPAPTDASLTVFDSNGAPVQFAVVRAYAVPTSSPGAAVQIGESFSDQFGHFSMYLAPLP